MIHPSLKDAARRGWPAGFLFLAGCDGPQSALDPKGVSAEHIAEIGWVLFSGGAAIFAFVMILTAWALFARRRNWLARDGWIVGGGVVFPVVVLTALLVYTLGVARDITGEPPADPLRVEVVGVMWWWEVRYTDLEGGQAGPIVSANEIHVPVGRPVEITLTTVDVIHSFWVPNLAGKLDMVPGHINRLTLRATTPGVYRGQCAEYCGAQHARMALYVVAHSPEEFAAWLARERAPASDPTDPLRRQGREAFFKAGCQACHTIRGTPANGKLGPDLTHVGGRLSLAAGWLDNHVGTLAGWIADAQDIKPGNRMPSFDVLDGKTVRALAAYLEGLK